MKLPKKPRPGIPGKPSGEWGGYEVLRTLSTFIHSTGAVIITVAITLASKENVNSLWSTETIAGSVGVLVMTAIKLASQIVRNNVNKKI